jgi:hypothetical protein
MIDINDLTFGQARQLAAQFAAGQTAAQPSAPHPFVGSYVICRGTWSGVHAGTLVSKNGAEVMLSNSRRLWSWTAKGGVALSGLAQLGYKGGKVDVMNPQIALSDVIECIPTAAGVKESINAIA